MTGSRQLTAMQLEAQRRGWLLVPTRKNRTCQAHGHTVEDLEDPCPRCLAEAMEWQRLQNHDVLLRARAGEPRTKHFDQDAREYRVVWGRRFN